MPTFPSAHDAMGDGAAGDGGGGAAGGTHAAHQRQRREMEEAHGRGVKRLYQQEQADRFGDAFGDARAQRRPEMLRRLD